MARALAGLLLLLTLSAGSARPADCHAGPQDCGYADNGLNGDH